MIRKFDKFGRLVIPKAMRKQMNFEELGEADIDLVNNKIVITNPNNFDIERYIMEQINECDNAESKLIYADILNKINENKKER